VKRTAIFTVVIAAAVLFVMWIARNTRWEETTLPMPPKGEALTNPFYATQRLATVLGANAVHDRVFATPPPGAVVVLSSWHWTLDEARQHAIERWVESGGRLVIDDAIIGGEREFERWSGITRRIEARAPRRPSPDGSQSPCFTVEEQPQETSARMPATAGHVMCEVDEPWELATTRPAVWSLKSGSAVQAMRVSVGRGSVTRINSAPFRGMNVFDGDHGWLFVAATDLRRGDDVHFLSEEDHPPLLALMWQLGAPAIMLGLAVVALLLWRGGVRLGPLAAEPPSARRSLAEQVRGTARFAVRHGGGGSLYAAELRALDEAAGRRIAGYARLAADDRSEALTAVTPLAGDVLAAALVDPRLRRLHDLQHTLAVLEAARRHLVSDHTRVTHAAD
jgi:hypothetical protein